MAQKILTQEESSDIVQCPNEVPNPNTLISYQSKHHDKKSFQENLSSIQKDDEDFKENNSNTDQISLIPSNSFKSKFLNLPQCTKAFILTTIFAILALIICLILQFIIQSQSSNIIVDDTKAFFKTIKLESQSALCLDGTHAAYRISQEGDPSKVIIYFAGGGWCYGLTQDQVLQSCYQRSFMLLGSSSSLKNPQQLFPASLQEYYSQGISPPFLYTWSGILSRNRQNYFRNWTRVFIDYCDGAGHQGYRKDPIQYKDKKLYFRGHNNTIQTFQDLQRKIGIFTKADTVVLTGASAGGLAANMWANYVSQRMRKGKLYLASDAGFFYDAININTNSHLYKQRLKTMMTISNAEVELPVQDCVAKHSSIKESCMFSQNLYEFIKVPNFIVQSLYDNWSIHNILGCWCISSSLSSCSEKEIDLVVEMANNITKVIKRVMQNKKNGVFGINCPFHSLLGTSDYFNPNITVPQNSLFTPITAISQWLQNQNQDNVHLDTLPWPNNKPCA